jgi:hypothetical protein
MRESLAAQFLEALKGKRGARSVRKMALDMGMNPVTLGRVLKGSRGIGPDVLWQILSVYPELVVIFLRPEVPSSQSEVAKPSS